jgi:hypothetical protein
VRIEAGGEDPERLRHGRELARQILPATLRACDWSRDPAFVPALTPSGGYVGFHAGGNAVPWHNRAIARYFAEMRAG